MPGCCYDVSLTKQCFMPSLVRVDKLSREQVEVLNKLIHWMEEADSADESQAVSIGKNHKHVHSD